jgi:molybdate transport system substrate-binding protein
MLAAHGCVQEQQQLLSNRLVIVVPRSNPARVTVPEDLLSGRVRRVALAGEKTPAGIYAEQALRKYGVYDRMIAANRIARGAHVRLTLGFVLAGEAEAGVVYATDARAAGKHLEVVFTFPEDAHQPIIYSLVLLKSSKIHDASRRVYDYLRSAQAHAVFKQHGFLPAREVD